MGAPLAAVAGLLVAAEGHVKTATGAVDIHIARTDSRGHLPGVIEVAALDIARQSVGRIVGDADRLFFSRYRESW